MAEIKVSDGGIRNDVTLYNQGMVVRDGGVANDTRVGYNSLLSVEDGGVVNRTVVTPTGTVEISDGGVANDTTVSGCREVYDGGERVQYGTFYMDGGVACRTTVAGGCVFCFLRERPVHHNPFRRLHGRRSRWGCRYGGFFRRNDENLQ